MILCEIHRTQRDSYSIEHGGGAKIWQKGFLQYLVEQLLRFDAVNALEKQHNALLVPWYQTGRRIAFRSFLASGGIEQRESQR